MLTMYIMYVSKPVLISSVKLVLLVYKVTNHFSMYLQLSIAVSGGLVLLLRVIILVLESTFIVKHISGGHSVFCGLG
jgi:hypothetical protein